MNKIDFMGELPKSDKPWVMTQTVDVVLLSNPDHPPMTLENGKPVLLRCDVLIDRCCCECGDHFDGSHEDDYCPPCFDKLPDEIFIEGGE